MKIQKKSQLLFTIHLLWPLIISSLVYVLSLLVSFDYERSLHLFFEYLNISIIDSIPTSIIGKITYGSLATVMLLTIPYLFILICITDPQKVNTNNMDKEIKNFSLSGSFITTIYLFTLFSEKAFYSKKWFGTIKFILEYPVAFYCFLVLMHLAITWLWALIIKFLLTSKGVFDGRK